MSAPKDGGPAFPVIPPAVGPEGQTPSGYPFPDSGMSLRAYLAAHAPIDFAAAKAAIGTEIHLGRDVERAMIFGVWAALRIEFADEMLRQLNAEPSA